MKTTSLAHETMMPLNERESLVRDGGTNSEDNDDEPRAESGSEKNDAEEESRDHSASSDDDDESFGSSSSSESSSSSMSETSSQFSYDSERSRSEDESSSDDSFSTNDDSSRSREDDDDDASLESKPSRRSSGAEPSYTNASSSSRSNRRRNPSPEEDRTTAHPLSDRPMASYSSSNRVIIRRGVLPIVSHGLGPQSYDDQNCDPNASSGSTLIHRRGKSAAAKDPLRASSGGSSRVERDLPQCRRPSEDCANDNDKAGRARDSSRSRSSSRHKYRRRGGKSSSRHGNNDRKRKRKTTSDDDSIAHCCLKYLCCQTKKRSTQILIGSFALWIIAQCYYFYHLYPTFFADLFSVNRVRRRGNRHPITNLDAANMDHRRMYRTQTPAEMERLRRQRAREAREALGSAAGDFDPDAFRADGGGKGGGRSRRSKANTRRNKPAGSGRKRSRDSEGNTRTERMREGCSSLEWHSYHFPNCNEIHEIDLGRTIQHRRFPGKEEEDGEKDEKDEKASSSRSGGTFPWGFVGNGLWRDVFTCDPRGETVADGFDAESPPLAPAVLKMMKSEHPYDQRNLQRHRRDALVMERLSSSHHLVPIYGYCANTVLTQAISHTLDDVIYAREKERVKKWSAHGGYKTSPPLESWMGRDEDGELLATRETELGRIRLALGVFRGLMDLHEGDRTTRDKEWLPIVHADIQSKQYLVDATTGQIYLNDFNRCRFMGKKDPVGLSLPGNKTDDIFAALASDLESCPIYIPTSPGASRSPEEYLFDPLTEKLDIYSAGNILYGIITGNKPWNNDRGKHIKEGIKKGERPPVDESIRNAEGTVDAELTRLLDRVYEGDPKKRASAKEVVGELEKLLERELEKKKEKVSLQGDKEEEY